VSQKEKSFTAAEKYKVALEAIKGEQPLSNLSSRYQVHANQIVSWKKKALDYMSEGFSNKLKLKTQNYEEKLSELYRQIGQLKVENDFLKKKCDLFRS
jgi:transposase